MAHTRNTDVRRLRRFTGLCGVTALLAAAGCGNKSLQKLDASGGFIPLDAGGGGLADGGVSDGGGTADVGGAADRPAWDVPFAGRRSFIVTAQVFDGSGVASLASHGFTLTLDTGAERGIFGVPGGGFYRRFAADFGQLLLDGTMQFGVPVSAPCGGYVQYDYLRVEVDASGRLTGSGWGSLNTSDGEMRDSTFATMVLTGVPDSEPPTLYLSPGGDVADPWTPIWIVASEPLPGQQKWPVLRSAGGDEVDFESAMDEFVSVLNKPQRMLRFGDEYRATFQGITDLPGNEMHPAGAAFTTRPPPPLIAGDGFESITEATLGGAQVLSGAGAPVLAGTRSLYIPPVATLASQTQLAVRLAVAPGQKLVRFDFRTVNPSAASITWIVAGVGGELETATPASDVGAPTTAATINGTEVALGPTRHVEIPLRPDVRGEVAVVRTAAQGGRCGGPPPPPVPGAIIDDLRVE
jgi:hypothetical protein